MIYNGGNLRGFFTGVPIGASSLWGGEKEEFGYIPQIRYLVFSTGKNHHSTEHNGQVLPNCKGISTQVIKQIDKATKSGNRGMSIVANGYLQYLTPRLAF